eukprot:4886564-Pyramimonas_sp.AAC.1
MTSGVWVYCAGTVCIHKHCVLDSPGRGATKGPGAASTEYASIASRGCASDSTLSVTSIQGQAYGNRSCSYKWH